MVELNLTKRQQEIFEFIKRYSGEHGYPPTVRDIGKAIGLTSSSTVHAHLANLEKLGLLKRDPTKPRAIEVLVDKAKSLVAPAGLPLVGQVAAGSPILAEENVEDYVEIPPIAGGDNGEFILRVKGDSMQDAGILDGDHVTVHKQETAQQRRDRRRARRRGGDREALLQGEGPHPAPAGERRPRADPHARRADPRPRRGPLPEGGVMSATAVCEEQVQVRRERRPCARPQGLTLAQLLARAHEAVHAQRHGRLPGVRRPPGRRRARVRVRGLRQQAELGIDFRRRVSRAPAARPGRRRGAGRHVELAERVLEVLVHGTVAEPEAGGDVAVRRAERDVAEDLGLARGQPLGDQRRRAPPPIRRRSPE